jgi:hypothetical protein
VAAAAAVAGRPPPRALQTLLGPGPADAVFAELVAEGLLVDVPPGSGGYKGGRDTTFVPANDATRFGGFPDNDPEADDA